MTIEELQVAFEALRAEGYSDDDLLKISYMMYSDGKIDLDTLETFTAILGYEFTDEFINMSEEDKKTKGLAPTEEWLAEHDPIEEQSEGMTLDELQGLIEQLKSEGREEEEILGTFYYMYAEGKITLDELRVITETMGYKFTPEFEALPEEEKKRRGAMTEDDEEE